MTDISLLKLGIDVCLAGAVVYMSIRFARSSSYASGRGFMELEASLRALIQEAESSGRTLNDQLLKRQQAIEKSLIEIETAQLQVNRAVAAAEEVKVTLETEVQKARSINQRSQSQTARPPKPSTSPEPELNEESLDNEIEVTVEDADPVFNRPPEPPSFEIPVSRSQQAHSERRATAKARERMPAGDVRTNIYGDLITEERQATQPQGNQGLAFDPYKDTPTHGLAATIEKERMPESRPNPASAGYDVDIQEIYNSAEEMLRAGRDLQTVATKTRLPVEDVKMLSEMILRERIDDQAVTTELAKDPRLGVLANIKREVTTL